MQLNVKIVLRFIRNIRDVQRLAGSTLFDPSELTGHLVAQVIASIDHLAGEGGLDCSLISASPPDPLARSERSPTRQTPRPEDPPPPARAHTGPHRRSPFPDQTYFSKHLTIAA